MSWGSCVAADNLKLCCSAFASRLRVFHSRYYPQSEVRALFDIVRIVGARNAACIVGSYEWPRSGVPPHS